jgi:hypothetical protein
MEYPMLNLKFIASVAERDVDLVLVEEFTVNDEFRDFFSSRVYGIHVLAKSLGAWHSVSDTALGESDVVHVFQSEEGKRIALLIENKIDAPAQPTQPERYRKRGEKGVAEGLWDEFQTCIVAPEEYLEFANESDRYDCAISYEELLSFFVSRRQRDPRFLYKAQIIHEAILKRREPYKPKISKEMTEFVKDYVEMAKKEHPDLRPFPAKPRPAGSTWITFKPAGYSSDVSLSHQLTGGYVKLFIADAAKKFEEWKARIEPHLSEGMTLDVAGKSVGLSLEVPKIDPLRKSVNAQEAEVRVALEAAKQIDAVYRKAIKDPAGNA